MNISFSAFDVFAPPLESNRGTRLRYTYIGLRHPIERASDTPVLKSADDLRTDFVDAARRCNSSALRETWVTALATLSSDPGFAALNLQDLQSDDGRRFDSQAGKLFDEASSGHKIVLSTIAQLIAAVNDRTLVLIDEPEAHLHPPLMASYVRTMSAILASRNGMAIVATHSPVFLQEVQASCAWILNRSNKVSSCFRPGIETYAEAIGILTREVFQLEVSHSGHHARIAEVCETATSLADVVAAFGGSLGSEGRAIAISILGSKSSQ